MSQREQFGWRTGRVLRWLFGDLSDNRTFLMMLGVAWCGGSVIGVLTVTLLPPWAMGLLASLCALGFAWMMAVAIVTMRKN